jgi:hypothetical protein
MQTFRVTSDKRNNIKTYTSSNYAQKWITKLCNYSFHSFIA